MWCGEGEGKQDKLLRAAKVDAIMIFNFQGARTEKETDRETDEAAKSAALTKNKQPQGEKQNQKL